jgi:hypothetical protein
MYEQCKQAYLEIYPKKTGPYQYGTLIPKGKMRLLKRINCRIYAQKSSLTLSDLTSIASNKPTLPILSNINRNSKTRSLVWRANSVVSAYNNEDDLKSLQMLLPTKYIGINKQFILHSTAQNQPKHLISPKSSISPNYQNRSKINPQSTDWQVHWQSSWHVNFHSQTSIYGYSIKQSTQRFNNFYPTSKKSITRATQYLSDMLSDLKSVVIQNYQP